MAISPVHWKLSRWQWNKILVTVTELGLTFDIFPLLYFRTFAVSCEHSILVSFFFMVLEIKCRIWNMVGKVPNNCTVSLACILVFMVIMCLLLKLLIFQASWGLFLSLTHFRLTSCIIAFNLYLSGYLQRECLNKPPFSFPIPVLDPTHCQEEDKTCQHTKMVAIGNGAGGCYVPH